MIVVDIERLKERRLQSWCQDGEHRIPDPEAARAFIDRHGMATLYSASSDVPNLYFGYMSDANAKADSSWDSPAGHVYEWRWALGRSEAAFYGALVAKKPTWISWSILPLVLGFAMERRDPEEMYADGMMSNDAIRVIRAFEGTSGVLSTKDLRSRAGFPTGKEQRAAYLKAIEELDSKMFLAKTFAADGQGDDMNHALVRIKHASVVEKAFATTPYEALRDFLSHYLPHAVYIDPKVFARHLRLTPQLVESAIDGLVSAGEAIRNGSVVATTHVEKERV